MQQIPAQGTATTDWHRLKSRGIAIQIGRHAEREGETALPFRHEEAVLEIRLKAFRILKNAEAIFGIVRVRQFLSPWFNHQGGRPLQRGGLTCMLMSAFDPFLPLDR